MSVYLADSALGQVYRGHVVVSGELSVVANLSDCLALRLSDPVFVAEEAVVGLHRAQLAWFFCNGGE